MFLRKAQTAIAAILLAAAPLAGAQDDAVPSGYVGILAGYVFPDDVRDADYGLNAFGLGGFMLGDVVALELNGFAQRTQRSSDHKYDWSYGGGLDLAIGTPAPGNPFFLVGGGAIYEDIKSTSKVTSGFGDLGLGVYLPFSFGGELWRVEGRYNAIFNNQTFPGHNILEDVRLNVGVLFGLGHREAPVPAPVAAATEPAPREAPLTQPAIGPDQDGDGTPDSEDQCPGTPKWVRPDANGCTPDSDDDGVADDRDCCPATPPGTPIDAQGCPLVPPPPPPAPGTAAPVQPVQPDEDGDGVPDTIDKCPHTPPGSQVGAEGCVLLESVELTRVHYEWNSDLLTVEGFRLLNSVAATLLAHPTMTVEVEGHADVTGSDPYNNRLSQRRANQVRDFLIYQGVAPDRVRARGYGRTQPVATNKTEKGRAENRRVAFKILTP